MINAIQETIHYKVENNILNYSGIFKCKEQAEAADKYLQSVINILDYLKVRYSDKDTTIVITTKQNRIEWEEVIIEHYLAPDWEGHHPNGSSTTSRIPVSKFGDRLVKNAFLEKVKKANNLPNKWDDFVKIYDACIKIFPFDERLKVVYNCKYLSICGIKLFNF